MVSQEMVSPSDAHFLCSLICSSVLLWYKQRWFYRQFIQVNVEDFSKDGSVE